MPVQVKLSALPECSNLTVIRRMNGELLGLKNGASTLLCHGDAFWLLASRPDQAMVILINSQQLPGGFIRPADARVGTKKPKLIEASAGASQPNASLAATGRAALRPEASAGAFPQTAEKAGAAQSAEGGAVVGPGASGSRSQGVGSTEPWTTSLTVRASKPSETRQPGHSGALSTTPSSTPTKASPSEPARAHVGGFQAADAREQIVLVLAGAPGSGKSTLAKALVAQSSVRWVHLNQDTVPGRSRKNVLRGARQALGEGAHVIIDRTNVDVEARKDFVALKEEFPNVQLHALVLDLQFKLCVDRVNQRTDHPTLKPGGNHKGIIAKFHNLLQKPGNAPSTSEGFISVMLCKTSVDADAALTAWLAYAGAPGSSLRSETSAPNGGTTGTTGTTCSAPQAATTVQEGSTGPSGDPWALWSNHVNARGFKQSQQQMRSTTCTSTATTTAAAAANFFAPRAKAATASQALHVGPPQVGQRSKREEEFPREGSPEGSAHKRLRRDPLDTHRKASQQGTATEAKRSASSSGSKGAEQKQPGTTRPSFAGNPRLNILQRYAADPKRYSLEWEEAAVDDLCVRMLDKYPKAQYHCLVVARDPKLVSVQDLCPKDVPLLQHMRDVGLAWIAEKRRMAEREGGKPFPPFRMGFHQVPSLPQLHLHVMSQDMCGQNMKKKEHWNSFTTEYFMPMDKVLLSLSNSGCVTVDGDAMEVLKKRTELRCHRCGASPVPKNMPSLLQHVRACSADFPSLPDMLL